MNIIIAVTVIVVYAVFLFRFVLLSILWFRASNQRSLYPSSHEKTKSDVYLSTALDIILFRRMFNSNKLIWLGSWTFHVSFLLVGLRHLRYFFGSLPGCIMALQPVGVFAGYLLSISLVYLIIVRTATKNRYTSIYNYFILSVLAVISVSGLVMRNFFAPDLVAVKYFTLGIFSLDPHTPPGNIPFIMHGSVFLILLPYLPSHILAAPFVNLDANRRREELRAIIHDE